MVRELPPQAASHLSYALYLNFLDKTLTIWHIIQAKEPQQRALFYFFATAMVAYASTVWMRSMVLLPHLLLYCNYGLREAHKHFIGLNR